MKTTMRRPYNPPHPSLTLRDDVLPALGLNVTQAAGQLGVTRMALSRMLNGRAAISPEMALRIEAWLGKDRGGDAQVWLAEQTAYDMWQTEQRLKDNPAKRAAGTQGTSCCLKDSGNPFLHQLDPQTEKRDTFTRRLGHLLEGNLERLSQ